jgi:ankyrin repeat protein
LFLPTYPLNISISTKLMTLSENTDLFRACCENDVAAIHSAVSKGADLNISAHGTSLLRNACVTDSLDALRALLELGADANRAFTYVSPVNGKSEAGRCALMYAANVNCARLLVEHGADVNAHDAQGETALMRMAWFGNVEIVDYLLQVGADAKICKPPDGKLKQFTALDIANNKLALLDAVPVEGRNEPGFGALRLRVLRTIELLTSTGGV